MVGLNSAEGCSWPRTCYARARYARARYARARYARARYVSGRGGWRSLRKCSGPTRRAGLQVVCWYSRWLLRELRIDVGERRFDSFW